MGAQRDVIKPLLTPDLQILLLQVIESNAEAINFVESVIRSENISCGFTRVPAYLLPGGAEPVPGDSRDPRSSSSSSDKDRQGGMCI